MHDTFPGKTGNPQPNAHYLCNRLVHDGKEPDANLEALSVGDRVFCEDLVHEDTLPGHIIEWVKF